MEAWSFANSFIDTLLGPGYQRWTGANHFIHCNCVLVHLLAVAAGHSHVRLIVLPKSELITNRILDIGRQPMHGSRLLEALFTVFHRLAVALEVGSQLDFLCSPNWFATAASSLDFCCDQLVCGCASGQSEASVRGLGRIV